MIKTTTRRTTAGKTKASAEVAPSQAPGPLQRPGGKLGQVVERLETAEGAMLSELVDLTGWQKHTVRGALSRLRHRGFAIRLDVREGRKAYHLERMEG